MSQAVTPPVHLHQLGVVQEPIQNRGGARRISQELVLVFKRTVRCHHRQPGLVPAHHNLEEALAGTPGQLLYAHVVDDQQLGLEVLVQGLVLLAQHVVVEEVPEQVED
jgi:hypothetical protein